LKEEEKQEITPNELLLIFSETNCERLFFLFRGRQQRKNRGRNHQRITQQQNRVLKE